MDDQHSSHLNISLTQHLTSVIFWRSSNEGAFLSPKIVHTSLFIFSWSSGCLATSCSRNELVLEICQNGEIQTISQQIFIKNWYSDFYFLSACSYAHWDYDYILIEKVLSYSVNSTSQHSTCHHQNFFVQKLSFDQPLLHQCWDSDNWLFTENQW